MQKYLFALAVLLVPLTYGYVANSVYPTFSQCNPTTVSAIKAYWKLTGRPRNVLKMFEQNGDHILLHTSYDFKNNGNKCVYIKSVNGIMNVTFVPKNGDVPANLTYRVHEDADGVIRAAPVKNDAPEFRWNWHSAFSRNGIVACYVCSDYKGSKQPPLADIMVAKSSVQNSLITTTISGLNNLLSGWGINFQYNYGSECFLGKEPSSQLLPIPGLLPNSG